MHMREPLFGPLIGPGTFISVRLSQIIRLPLLVCLFLVLNQGHNKDPFVESLESITNPQLKEQLQQQRELKCLSCIRQAHATNNPGDLTKQKCEGYYCGPFQISYQYWAEAGKPSSGIGSTGSGAGRDFEKCAKDSQCAEQAVRAYFKRFKKDCNNDGRIDCLDMAALHKGGPASCSSDWFYKSRFWQAFNKTTCATVSDFNEEELADQNAGKRLSGMEKQPNDVLNRVVTKNQSLTSECLDCICDALTSCGLTTSAQNCGTGSVCGPFAISQTYWKDGRRPGASWTACARTRECSIVTIRNYMEKNKRDCTGDGYVTCEDYAAIHRRGPRSCTNRDVLREPFWQKFLACRANQRPTNDANLVKVDSNQGTDLASRGDSIQSNVQPKDQQAVVSIATSTTNNPTLVSALPPVLVTNSVLNLPSSSAPAELHPTRLTSSEHHSKRPSASAPNQVSHAYELAPVKHAPETSSPSDTQFTTITANHYPPSRTRIKAPISTTPLPVSPSDTQDKEHTPSAISNRRNNGPQQPKHPPIHDYNQPPTIIVSKPLGAASTQRLSPQPLTLDSIDNSSAPALIDQSNTAGHSDSKPQEFTSTTARGTSQSDSDSIIDYSIPEPFPFASAPRGAMGEEIVHDAVDRTNFDKVVNGIVANPDFSKSYPPTLNSGIDQSSPRRKIQETKNSTLEQQGPAHKSRLGTQQIYQVQQQATNKPTSYQSSGKRDNQDPQITLDSRQQLHQRPVDSIDKQQPAITGSSGEPLSIVSADPNSLVSPFDLALNVSNRIASECLDCICDASSNCDTTVQCISKQREKNRCGLYMISWNQFKESDIYLTTMLSSSQLVSSNGAQQSGSDDSDEKLYYECSTDKICAERLIHLYIEKHQKDCNNDGKIDCYDIAAIHRVGPEMCDSGKFLSSQYWKDFNICYATDRAVATTTTTSIVPSMTTILSSSTTTTTTTTTRRQNQSYQQMIVS